MKKVRNSYVRLWSMLKRRCVMIMVYHPWLPATLKNRRRMLVAALAAYNQTQQLPFA